jgi:lysophospholipid acyltransferase (LPLAT)-like uncharacterized protein
MASQGDDSSQAGDHVSISWLSEHALNLVVFTQKDSVVSVSSVFHDGGSLRMAYSFV